MTGLSFELRTAGSCIHPEHIVMGSGPWTALTFPAMFGVIEHPERGVVLYDTGYGEAFIRATERFPERLYRWVTPVRLGPAQTARAQLSTQGIDASDVRAILISHFHADHVAALEDFPRAEFIYLPEAYDAVRRLSRLDGLRHGFLPELIPRDFSERSVPLNGRRVPLPEQCAPFREGIDVFGDGRLRAVPLPGHARGQLGLFVESEQGLFFLVADACWTSRSFRERRMPHPVTRLLVDDHQAYESTLSRLHELAQRGGELRIVPSHCEEALRRYAVEPT